MPHLVLKSGRKLSATITMSHLLFEVFQLLILLHDALDTLLDAFVDGVIGASFQFFLQRFLEFGRHFHAATGTTIIFVATRDLDALNSDDQTNQNDQKSVLP